MRHTNELLKAEAHRRLREFLGREPTAKEISELRHGEQALGLEHVTSSNARQLVAEGKALRNQKNRLLTGLRENQQKNRRLMNAAARNWGDAAMLEKSVNKKNADQRAKAANQRRSVKQMQKSTASLRKRNDQRQEDFSQAAFLRNRRNPKD